MLKTISGHLKGLITGLLMLIASLLLFYSGQSVDSGWQYLIYAIYIAGIVWTIWSVLSPEQNFGKLFSEGFRCLIAATLVMALFTFAFSKMHPELKEEAGKAYKEFMIEKKEKTPVEIDATVLQYKKYFTAQLVSVAIFGYLIGGALIAASCCAIIILIRALINKR